MFDSMKIERRLAKSDFKALEPKLHEDLLDRQAELIAGRARSILVLVNGADGAGKGAVLNQLYGWLDVRKLRTLTYGAPTDEERARPGIWRYWRDMPAAGEIGIVLGSWYHDVLADHVLNGETDALFTQRLDEIRRLEAMLRREGVFLLKLWLYLEPQEALARLKALKRNPFDRPLVREWSAIKSKKQRRHLEESAVEAFRLTSTPEAPWIVVPSEDGRFRDAMVGGALLETLGRAIASQPRAGAEADASAGAAPPRETETDETIASLLPKASILSTVDLTRTLEEEDYRAELETQQTRISRLTQSSAFQRRGLVCVFEGSDAAGKSSTIMRLRQALDPRCFRVHPIAAPTDEERARPYLWRFWRSVPARGHIAVFDRSWYGRVLVERVEKLAQPEDWGRAYDEINDFEHRLDEAGYIVVKFWLAISQEEQARRFEARERVAYKRFKLTPEDWRNREKWPLYEEAVTDMVDRTSTFYAPWTLVSAEDKRWCRVAVLSTIADRLDAALK
ncbi:polyphosphate:AMP phosphotransferase [Aquabacter spiritensis]|uniref:Polyphosphate:AMP phosphotransferase n=1 Tax=Aquabacter spiritensis TaxID=933073 RepID=A0A4R3LTT0_9HYPH|nr:polyphosphate:AMP phosphotransferase [Aquabacter spiritensis]TCT03962.1 polyphosphate:AMP phosphotransferase [Aquabacter spiritensis]